MNATLKISKITDRFNGYGMPVIEVISDQNIKVVNRGYNVFEALTDIDESDLLRLRTMFNTIEHDTVMLEITTPERKTNCWYKLAPQYLGSQNPSCLMW
jgi:hypothetical protein